MVARKLKASSKTAHIPVLVLSGSVDAAEAASVIELGAAEFLSKPAEPEDVLAAVVRLAEA